MPARPAEPDPLLVAQAMRLALRLSPLAVTPENRPEDDDDWQFYVRFPDPDGARFLVTVQAAAGDPGAVVYEPAPRPDAAPAAASEPPLRERLLDEALRRACADLIKLDGNPGDLPGDVAESYLLQAEDAQARGEGS